MLIRIPAWRFRPADGPADVLHALGLGDPGHPLRRLVPDLERRVAPALLAALAAHGHNEFISHVPRRRL